jgi:segregation and condensation protein A
MFEIKTNIFSGPLDLLVELARSHDIDILKIKMVNIIEDFIEYINRAKQESINLTTDFMGMASYLILLKSRLLLPKDEEDEEDAISEINDLFDIIKKYELIKDAAFELQEYHNLQEKLHFRADPELSRYIEHKNFDIDELDPYSLTKKVLELLDRNKKNEDFASIIKDSFNIEDEISKLFDFFLKNKYTEFSMLTEGKKKEEIVTLFFALLIMVKQQFLRFTQNVHFGPIYINSQIEENSVLDLEKYEY